MLDKSLKKAFWIIPAVLVDIFWFLVIMPFCIFIRLWRGNRITRHKKIFMGTMHINNWVYVAKALRQKHYEVNVVVWSPPKNEIGSVPYDIIVAEKFKIFFHYPILRYLMQYGLFFWAVFKYDIFIMCFMGRIIDKSVLGKWYELPLLKLAGKRILLNTYGGDVMTPRLTLGKKNYKYSVLNGYQEDPYYSSLNEKIIGRNRNYCQYWADVIISAIDHVEYLNRVDVYLHLRCVDTDELKPVYRSNNKIMQIVHAPNHPKLKGTDYLIKAVDDLKKEGLNIGLNIIEGYSHDTVLELVSTCDVVADQFLIGAYSRFAIEGMALGKPILCYLRENLIPYNLIWRDCPIVNTNPDTLFDNIKKLYFDKELRNELGKKGRIYVERYHSLNYIGEQLSNILINL
jgi:glycosyltransferase involved in cell wall biosynthesis